MATSNSPSIGLTHPTINPHPSVAVSTDGRSEYCECNSCEYTTEIDDDLPPKCPDCGGALTRATP
jgi:NAD-dependent SIR2 family protein deacetylase